MSGPARHLLRLLAGAAGKVAVFDAPDRAAVPGIRPTRFGMDAVNHTLLTVAEKFDALLAPCQVGLVGVDQSDDDLRERRLGLEGYCACSWA
jgi:hypothetical protein